MRRLGSGLDLLTGWPRAIGGPSAVVQWSPADVSLGAKGFFWDASTVVGMFQDAAGTVPVTANGNPIGQWDLDTMVLSQATSAQKPTYSTTVGTVFDGVDDVLNGGFAGGVGPNCSVFFRIRKITGTVGQCIGSEEAGRSIGIYNSLGGALAPISGSGTPTFRVDNAVVTNQLAFYTALNDAGWHTVEASALTLAGWSDFNMAANPSLSNYANANMPRGVLIETASLTTDIRAEILSWLSRVFR